MTAEQFDQWVYLPENITAHYEFINGVAVHTLSSHKSSTIAVEINYLIKDYLRKKKLKGLVTGSDGGYIIGTERYIPDVAYTSPTKASAPLDVGYTDLVVEVISNPQNSAEINDLLIKVPNYVAAGAVVWVIDPQAEQVRVYAPNTAVQVLFADMTLTGGDILPDFAVRVGAIFEA